jgi:hypothetical protein
VYGGLDISYLTPRLAVMAFPTFPTSRLRSRNDAGAVAALLSERPENAMDVLDQVSGAIKAGAFKPASDIAE